MNQAFNLDMTMMYAVHDAFRRDLARIDKMTMRTEGWGRFSRFLHAHHVAEDEALWPVVRDTVGDQPDDLKLFDDVVTEHAALGPLLQAIDAGLAHGESAPEARADLAARLQEHLTHEEEGALPVIDRTLTEEQWMSFGEVATATIGDDMPQFLPWLLDGADTERAKAVLGVLPEPAQQTYRDEWQPAYAANDWWGAP